MEEPVNKERLAWQPVTPRGVSAFAQAPPGRLLLIQLLVALLAAAVVTWFLYVGWFAVVRRTITQMPSRGEIRGGKLQWPAASPAQLAENRFLALAVDLNHSGEMRSPAHVQVEFGQDNLKIFSLLGFVQIAYPRGWVVGFNRVELGPWWGAWEPALLALAAGATIGGLLLSWAALATVYCWVAWLIGLFANRDLSLRGSWRLAGAALMPGALFMTGAMFLYGLGAIDLVRLAFAQAVHFVLGWVYLVISPFWLPRHPAAAREKANPFRNCEGPPAAHGLAEPPRQPGRLQGRGERAEG